MKASKGKQSTLLDRTEPEDYPQSTKRNRRIAEETRAPEFQCPDLCPGARRLFIEELQRSDGLESRNCFEVLYPRLGETCRGQGMAPALIDVIELRCN